MSIVTRCALSAALVLSLTACVTTNASRLGTSTVDRPIVLPQNVALYRIAAQVPGKYEEIALLNSSGDSGFTNEAKMFESMKKKAGEMGANGVILDAVSEPGAGAKVAAAIFGVSAQRKGKAIAIWVFPAGGPAALSQSQAPLPQAPTPEPCVSCSHIGSQF